MKFFRHYCRKWLKDSTFLKYTVKYNDQIAPNFYLNPGLSRTIFKRFVPRAREICSQKHLRDEIKLSIDVFVENGHGRNHMLAIINEKSYQKNEANYDSNVKNMMKLP